MTAHRVQAHTCSHNDSTRDKITNYLAHNFERTHRELHSLPLQTRACNIRLLKRADICIHAKMKMQNKME